NTHVPIPSVPFFFFSSRRRHTRSTRDWSSDVCSSDLRVARLGARVKTDSLGRPLKEGDRVAYTYFYPCGRCHVCLNNEPAACPRSEERRVGKECSNRRSQ